MQPLYKSPLICSSEAVAWERKLMSSSPLQVLQRCRTPKEFPLRDCSGKAEWCVTNWQPLGTLEEEDEQRDWIIGTEQGHLHWRTWKRSFLWPLLFQKHCFTSTLQTINLLWKNQLNPMGIQMAALLVTAQNKNQTSVFMIWGIHLQGPKTNFIYYSELLSSSKRPPS